MATAAARRYATSIFELARDEGRLDEWQKRLELTRQLLTEPEVAAVLANPTIDAGKRMHLVISTRLLDHEAGNLARLLIESNRVAEIDEIVVEFMRLADDAAGRVRATVTTAIELSAADRDRIASELSARLEKEVRIDVVVDPRILGGLKLQYGDRVVDASVSNKLQQLRRRLASVS